MIFQSTYAGYMRGSAGIEDLFPKALVKRTFTGAYILLGCEGSMFAGRGRKRDRKKHLVHWGSVGGDVGFVFQFELKYLFKFTHLLAWVRACCRGICVV